MPRGTSEDASILEYALRALEQERDSLQSKIDHIRKQLGGRKQATASAPAADSAARKNGRGKRVLSDAARKRIAAAQKKRWAAHRKSLEPPKKTVARKSAPKKAAVKKAEAASE